MAGRTHTVATHKSVSSSKDEVWTDRPMVMGRGAVMSEDSQDCHKGDLLPEIWKLLISEYPGRGVLNIKG